MEKSNGVIPYITEKCKSLVRLVFKMKNSPEELIPSMKRHLQEVAQSEVEKNEISTVLYEDVSSFIADNENKLLQHIIDKYRRQMLEQKLDKTKRKLEKTEDDNRTLGERNWVLKRQKTKLEDRWTRAHFKCMDMRGENASLSAKIKELGQELRVFKECWLREQRRANARLAAEKIGLEKALAAANMNLDKKLAEDPNLMCCLTLQPFKHPVYASDGNTYEKVALEEWIRRGGKSPLTREAIKIVGDNRAVKNLVDALTPSP